MSDDQAHYADVPRLRRLLAASGFDAVIAAWPANVAYLSGFYHPDLHLTWERLHIVVWPAGGEPVFVVPAVRADNWNGQANPSFAAEEARPFIDDIRGYAGEQQDMVRVVAEVLSERGLGAARVGVEYRSLPAKLTIGLSAALPTLRYADAWPLLNEMRTVKTANEVAQLTRVNRLTARAVEAELATVRPGETELEVGSRITGRLFRDGMQELSHSVLGSGARAGQWHPWPSPQVFADGALIRADWGVRADGYTSDIARTAVVGTANRHQRDVFARLSEVHDLVVEATRPGVLPVELVGFARRHYERLGLEFRWTIVGHGIGLVLHEEPQLTLEYDSPVVEGMTMEIELGWVDQHEGYHLEDLVHVGRDATLNLTRAPGDRRLIESTPSHPSRGATS